MNRYDKFLSMMSHSMHKKLISRLSKAELDLVVKFILDNSHLDENEYSLKCNRWMLDQPKPKNYSAMWAIVMQAK